MKIAFVFPGQGAQCEGMGRDVAAAYPVAKAAFDEADAALDFPTVLSVCEQAGQGQVVSPANLNSPGQTVIAGNREAVERAVTLAKQAGAKRAILLQVSAPFHCALMKPAEELMSHDLDECVF